MKVENIATLEELQPMLIPYFLEVDSSYVSIQNEILLLDYPFAKSYFNSDSRHAIKFILNGSSVAFGSITDYFVVDDLKSDCAIAEFLVFKSFRKKKIGSQFVARIFERFKGRWEIKVNTRNNTAVRFWDSITERLKFNSLDKRLVRQEDSLRKVYLIDVRN